MASGALRARSGSSSTPFRKDLNDPHTAVGRLIASAAERSQVFVVTHAAKLIATLEKRKGCNLIRLEKQFGETKIVDSDELDVPAWRWPAR